MTWSACDFTQCLPCCGELSCQRLCDRISYLAASVPIPSNIPTLPSVLNTLLHCLYKKKRPWWMETLSQRCNEERGKMRNKRLIPCVRQGAMQMGQTEEASLQWQCSTEGSSFTTLARLGFNLLSLPTHIYTHSNRPPAQ